MVLLIHLSHTEWLIVSSPYKKGFEKAIHIYDNDSKPELPHFAVSYKKCVLLS